MSCYFEIEKSNFKIKKENAKNLMTDIMQENIKRNWEITEFVDLKSLDKIFDYMGIKVINNDFDNTLELDEEYFYNDTYEVWTMQEIFEVMAKYVEDCYIQFYWQEYGEREKWIFKNGKLEIKKEIRKWEE